MASAVNKGLGKGLGALLQNAEPVSEHVKAAVVELKINDINPNREQPRKNFDPDRLNELADSIRTNGVIQPIIVCRTEQGYQIVAGERRWRAARIAGLTVIPAIVRELTSIQVLQQALIENIQRQDLNPLEEASALERLIQEHRMTQEQVATVVGRSRPAIANTLRLLHLPPEIQQMLIQEELTAGHARALLSIPESMSQTAAARTIIDRDLSVRDTERLVKQLLQPKRSERRSRPTAYDLSVREVERKLTGILATKVRIKDRAGKGSIEIQYYSEDDLERILDLFDKL